LAERIRAEVFRTDRLHVDDTPVRVLDPTVRQTRGKDRGVKEGRIWTYVRDDRPWGRAGPAGGGLRLLARPPSARLLRAVSLGIGSIVS
jgi:hypothetical protein